MIPIPEQYVVETFYKCVSHPSYNKYAKTYNGSCPFCREGKSWGKKHRFFYIPEKELTYCHNCGYSEKVLKFVMDVSGKPFVTIINEVKKGEFNARPKTEIVDDEVKLFKQPVNSLPEDSINLNDNNQLNYYKENSVIKICKEYITDRRLDTAINRPHSFYISLADKVHKNRLVLPFFDTLGNIIYYQTRTLLASDNKTKPKYLSKVGAERCLSGLSNIDSSIEHLFLFEGPIDSYFIKNGLAVCGITDESNHVFTEVQQQQINSLQLYNKIWCLDNQWNDKAALKKSIILADNSNNVFIWPEELRTLKDLNEYCIKAGIDGVDPDFILKNTFKGLKAKLMLNKIKASL